MATIAEIRQQYPGVYDDMPDQALADALYTKHYADMPREAFDAKVGFAAPAPERPTASSLPMFAQGGAMDQASDLAQSAGAGVEKGAAGVAGIPGSLGQFYDFATRKAIELGGKGLEKVGAISDGKTDKFLADAERLNRQWQTPAERRGDVNYSAGIPFPTPHGVESGMISAAGPFYEPKTKLGRYAETGMNFATQAMVAPGSILGTGIRYGLVPGLASEAAGQATEGTAYEPYARGAAALGTAGVGAWQAAPSYGDRIVARAAEGVTPQQYTIAEALTRDAQARGITLTPAEAIQSATNGASRLGDVQRIAESTAEGAAQLNPVMAARPAQMQAATQAELGNIAPPVTRPYDIAPQVQEIGVEARQAAEAMRTRRADPYYKAAESESVNPNAVRSVYDQMGNAAAKDTTGILSGPVNDAQKLLVRTPGQPATAAERVPVMGPDGQVIRYEMRMAQDATPPVLANDINNLDRTRKYLRDKVELPPFAADAIPKEEGKVIGGLMQNLRARMEANSPNFATGRREYETASRSIVDPLAASPTGQLAEAATPEAQRGILFPQNPLPGSQSAIGNAVESIANRNPELARAVVRQEAERMANKTVSGLDAAGRPDQFGGAKFAKDIRSNPQKAANFEEAIRRSGASPASLNQLVDVLGATGWRQRPGSLTAFNQEALADLKSGGVQSLVQALMKPMQQAKDTAARVQLGKQAATLAELLVSGPAGVRRIEELAASRQGSSGNALARALLTYQSSTANKPIEQRR